MKESATRPPMRIPIASIIIISTWISVSSCGSSDEPGNAETFERIDSLTDCNALQTEFEQFEIQHYDSMDADDPENVRVAEAYMGATDDRMSAIGCQR